MAYGLYMAETPNFRCLFGKTTWFNKIPVYYHNVAHNNPINYWPFNIFAQTNSKGIQQILTKKLYSGMLVLLVNHAPWLKPSHRLVFVIGSGRPRLN